MRVIHLWWLPDFGFPLILLVPVVFIVGVIAIAVVIGVSEFLRARRMSPEEHQAYIRSLQEETPHNEHPGD